MVEDQFIRQLELMSKALGTMLARIIGIKQQNKAEEAYLYAQDYFKREIKMELEELIDLKENEFLDRIKQGSFKSSHLEILSKIFFELSETKEKSIQLKLLLKSKVLLQTVNENDKIFSMEKQQLMQAIEDKIQLLCNS